MTVKAFILSFSSIMVQFLSPYTSKLFFYLYIYITSMSEKKSVVLQKTVSHISFCNQKNLLKYFQVKKLSGNDFAIICERVSTSRSN